MKFTAFPVLAILVFIGNLQAATVTAFPNPAEVTLGDTFSVNILAADFDVVLDGGGLNIQYDPSIVQLNTAVVDTAVWDPLLSGVNGTIDNTSGNITGLYFSSFANVTGDFSIATLEFTATALGISPLQLSHYDANPFASGGTVTPVTLNNGSIVVSPVPLPAAGWLMLSGFGLLIGWSRHRFSW
jgi:hypothetical protein